ncbi:MAG: hypothetical protein ACI9LN_004326, partial [Saprospiraceae bacterium]
FGGVSNVRLRLITRIFIVFHQTFNSYYTFEYLQKRYPQKGQPYI